MSPAQMLGTHLSSTPQAGTGTGTGTGTAGAGSQVKRAGAAGAACGWRIRGATRRRRRSPGSLRATKPHGGLSARLPNGTNGGRSGGHEGVNRGDGAAAQASEEGSAAAPGSKAAR